MKIVGSLEQMYQVDISALPKDVCKLALNYLRVPTGPHRCFAAALGMLYILLNVCFLRYAFVEKYHLVDSFMYGNVKFSYVDFGYPEMFGYCLELFCVAMFVAMAWLRKKTHWYAWAAIFLITCIDDAVGLHELTGAFFYSHEAMAPAVGELAFFIGLGLVFVMLWCAGILALPESGEDFGTYLLFSMYFGILSLFGIGADAIHGIIKSAFHVSETLLALVEDGSELFMLCVFALSVLGLWYRGSSLEHSGARVPQFSV